MPVLSDKVVSLLRTVVPVIWGSAIAWLLTVISVPAPVGSFLTNQTDLVVVASITLWYAAFRWLEPKLPAWLTRIVLGSNQTPSYAVPVLGAYLSPTTAVNGTATVVTTSPVADPQPVDGNGVLIPTPDSVPPPVAG